MQELELKMKELAAHYLGSVPSTVVQEISPFAPQSSIQKRLASLQSGILLRQERSSHISSKLPPVPVPTFDGTDLEAFLKEFERWMRLTGITDGPSQMQLDCLIQACTPKVKKLAEKVVEEQADIISVFHKLEDLFPKLENDISLRSLVEKLPQLTANPDPAAVAQLFVELEEIFARMSPGSLSDQEKFILLIKKLHPNTFGELRGDRYYKHRTETYQALKEALLEKTKEDWLERQLFAQKKQVLQTLDAQPNAMQVDTDQHIFQRPLPENGKGKGKGKGKGAKGKGKGRADFQSSRPGLHGNLKDPNWQSFNAQAIAPRFSATIYCKFCRKKGHYEDACWSKAKYEKKRGTKKLETKPLWHKVLLLHRLIIPKKGRWMHSIC